MERMRQVNVDWFIDLVANGCSGNVKSVDWHSLCMSGRIAMCPVPEQARAGTAIRVMPIQYDCVTFVSVGRWVGASRIRPWLHGCRTRAGSACQVCRSPTSC